MINIIDFLNELAGNDIVVYIENGKLLSKIPKNKYVAPETFQRLRDNKELIINFLEEKEKIISNKNAISPFDRNKIKDIPLSFAQKSLWFINRLQGSHNYHVPTVLNITGFLNVDFLKIAFTKILHRHEILRTVYIEDNEEIYQKKIVEDNWQLKVIHSDDQNLEGIIGEEIARSFDLSKDFMLRATLVKISENNYTLVFVIHHIATDEWSTPILITELVDFYSDLIEERISSLPKLGLQYADYSVWQNKQLDKIFYDAGLNYWSLKLKGVQPINIPSDFLRPAHMSTKGKTLVFKINSSLSKELNYISLKGDTTAFMTLLAAFKVLLFKYSEQKDICVGIPISNRTKEETINMVGYFVNSMAIRSYPDGNITFDDYLQKVKETCLEAYQYQQIPFDKIVDNINEMRDLSRSPIFQFVFSYQKVESQPEINLNGLMISPAKFENSTTKYDVIFNIADTPTGLTISVQYCTDIFHKKTIKRLVKHYKTLLKSVFKNSFQTLEEIDIITDKERRKLLSGLNKTHVDYLCDKTVLDLFEEMVLLNPEKLAVVDGKTRLTYNELNERANKLAYYLHETYLIDNEEIIAIICNRNAWYLIGILAILKTSGAYLPIDVEYPAERKKHVISDAKVKVILTESDMLNEIMEFGTNTIAIDIIFPTLKSDNVNFLREKITLNSLAYVIYTSGSTGTPKGVAIEHKGLLNLCLWHKEQYGLSINSNSTIYSGTGFDASVWEIFPYLTTGGTLYPVNDNNIRYNVMELKKFLIDNCITHTYLPTQVCVELINNNVELKDLTILTGGDKLVIPKRSELKIFNNYGPTENTVVATSQEVKKSIGVIDIGKPISNISVYVVNKKEKLVPLGFYGELLISGDGIARGYLNDKEKTNEKFIIHPFKNDCMAYKTGDIVRWNVYNNLEFKGRTDDQIKIRGFRIELGEIEAVLNECTSIKNSVVICDEDTSNNKKLIAYIITTHKLVEKDLKNFIKSKLPNYMIPHCFIQVESFPITNNGKIDKVALAEIAKKHEKEGQDYVGPQNETEKRLIEIWKESLEVSKIGIHDDFFELGGHSLLSIKVINKVKAVFNIDISVRDIFNYTTISELSYFILNKDDINEKNIENIDLEVESLMDIDFSKLQSLERYNLQSNSFFLTGATGFVGVYILSELLKIDDSKIYCLVRAENNTEGKEKIINKLRFFNLFEEDQNEKIIPVLGDISKSRLGISEHLYHELLTKVDCIFHSATFMDHFSSYEKLKAANVGGNIEIVKMAISEKTKKIIYISSPGKYIDGFHEGLICENDSRDFEKHKYASGYSSSKWVGEKIMSKALENGLDVQIHRIGLVTGDLKSGKMPVEQWFTKALVSCYEIGLYTPEFLIPIVPVDFISQSLINLALSKNIKSGYFHLFNPNLVSLKNMFGNNNVTNKHIISVTFQEILIKILEQSDKLYLPIIPFIGYGDPEVDMAMQGHHPVVEDNSPTGFSTVQTFRILKEEAGIEFPDLAKYFNKYLYSAIEEFKDKLKTYTDDDYDRTK